MNTPVAFIVFNRPDCTARTLAAIRQARPPKLFVIADGPRPHRPDDAEKCAATRKVVDDGVDWPCEVERDYAVQNLGCAKRVGTGLTWAFSRSERLVVLEDDCLPDRSFFAYCDELLERYAYDTRIGQICACPRYFSEFERSTSYIFSQYGPCWGWASWRRAWNNFDLYLKDWPQFLEAGGLDSIVQSPAEHKIRTELYSAFYENRRMDTWDYQWGYAKMSQGMLSVIPCKNLIENIGFGGDGTHYGPDSVFTLRQSRIDFPLKHPAFILPDAKFDRVCSAVAVMNTYAPLWKRALRKLRRLTFGLPKP